MILVLGRRSINLESSSSDNSQACTPVFVCVYKILDQMVSQ